MAVASQTVIETTLQKTNARLKAAQLGAQRPMAGVREFWP